MELFLLIYQLRTSSLHDLFDVVERLILSEDHLYMLPTYFIFVIVQFNTFVQLNEDVLREHKDQCSNPCVGKVFIRSLSTDLRTYLNEDNSWYAEKHTLFLSMP